MLVPGSSLVLFKNPLLFCLSKAISQYKQASFLKYHGKIGNLESTIHNATQQAYPTLVS